MNRKNLVSLVIVAMLLCSPLVLPVRATSSDWSKPRPSKPIDYYETIGNSKTDDVASIDMGVHIFHYHESGDPDDDDYLRFRVSASANTRVGIQYQVLEEDYIYDWQNVSEPTGITGDDSGTLLDLGFNFLYYGVEYREVWVCSNGFITLNKTSTNANPQSIPSMDEPNPIIAVFWRDLHFGEGSSITYSRDVYFDSRQYLVVSWNNVLDDSGNPQTFQVLIQNRQAMGCGFHNDIFFQYESITKSYPTTVGTEDQVGNKGTSYDYNNLHNQACLRFEYPIEGCRLERLKIKLTKSDSYAMISFLRPYIGGCNVILKEDENPFGDTFKAAIKTAASLALLKAGIMWNVMLITAEFAGVLAGDLSRPYTDEEHVKDAWEGDPEAWAYGDCVVENRPLLKPFDSTLAATVEWSFTDANNRDHDLTVTAEAWYKDLSNDNPYIVSTSVTLNMYINSPPNTPSTPSGPTSGYAGASYTYSTSTIDPNGDQVRYKFDWGDGNYTITPFYPSDSTVSTSHSWCSSGTYYVKVKAEDEYGAWSDWSPSLTVNMSLPTLSISASSGGTTNPAPGTYTYAYGESVTVTVSWYAPYFVFDYWVLDGEKFYEHSITVTMDSDHTLEAHFKYSGYEPPRPCPTLLVWNGTGYVDYGVIDIHNPTGEDVIREVSIAKQDLAVEDSKVKIRLQEGWLGLNYSESEIDQVKLYAVDDDGNSLPCPLKEATYNDQDVRPILKESDDVKLGVYLLETVDLEFLVPYENVQDFTFVIEGCNVIKW